MALYPSSPVPSMVSAPEIIDPSLSFKVDQGYQVSRPRTSRPRRRWQFEYLGLNTANMRVLRNYVMFVRLGALTFDLYHPTAVDVAVCVPTSPVTLQYQHGLYSGWWVGVSNSPNPSLNGGVFQVTVTSGVSVTLNGTTAAGIQDVCTVVVYVPRARVVAAEDTFAGPSTLIGPEQVEHLPSGRRSGFFNMSVQIEEQF